MDLLLNIILTADLVVFNNIERNQQFFLFQHRFAVDCAVFFWYSIDLN